MAKEGSRALMWGATFPDGTEGKREWASDCGELCVEGPIVQTRQMPKRMQTGGPAEGGRVKRRANHS